MSEIEDWRKRIDEIDARLVELINERSRAAIEIGEAKAREGIDIYDPERERAVIQHVREVNPGPLSSEAVSRVFERIIDESRRAEREVRAVAEEAAKE